MNTSENSEIKRLTDEDFNQISQMLNCEPAALKAVQQVEIDGREASLPLASPPFFSKDISSGTS